MESWDDAVKVKKRLGGNFWLLTNGKILNTSSGCTYDSEDIPATMKYEESSGGFPVHRFRNKFPQEIGTKFVTFDFVVDFDYSKSGKTRYVKFENFDSIDLGSIKISGKWIPKIDHGFELGCAYVLFLEAHPDYPSGYKIIKKRKLKMDGI